VCRAGRSRDLEGGPAIEASAWGGEVTLVAITGGLASFIALVSSLPFLGRAVPQHRRPLDARDLRAQRGTCRG
jgi:hypothetical protein